MLDPSSEPPAAPADEEQAAKDQWAAFWAAQSGSTRASPEASAGASPAAESPAPPAPPAWTRTYDLPTARKVVGAGLHLVASSSAAIRRASLYIGVLALGALGPVVVLLLVAIGRLMSDPANAAAMMSDPMLVLFEQPEIVEVLLVIYFLAFVGLLLLVAISIDAQAIAIALLGGVASERPLRLWEAVARARQVFWRILGAGLLVGGASAVITYVVASPFMRPLDTNTAITFMASMIGTLVVTPFAFASAGIVLGDVGAIESLQRSMALFRARPRIAFVVVLFTLVTSAIQTFAIGAGLDVAVRVAEFLGLGLDQGGIGLVLPGILILAFIVAFGSLTFTIAAIVAAPQVSAFLGLTFYSGGLDRARGDGATRPRRFRWVTLPMLAAMVILVLVAGMELPAISAYEPRPVSSVFQFVRTVAFENDHLVTPYGPPAIVEDPTSDHAGVGGPSFDIVQAEYGYLPDVPAWLLSSFDCSAVNVACSSGAPGPGATTFANGAYLFVLRMAGPPGIVQAGDFGEWGPVLAVPGFDRVPAGSLDTFVNATHAFITFVSGETRSMKAYGYTFGSITEFRTVARSTWVGNELITLVPVVGELPDVPDSWDAFALSRSDGVDSSIDTLRSTAGGALEPFPGPPEYWLVPLDGSAP